VALDNLRRFAGHGGHVVYGTDLGNGAVPPGIDVEEVRLLERGGLDLPAVLQAMTWRPVASGEPADLIGLAGDPREDLAALGRVAFVLRAGRRVV
jgi:imidazolonepropionase-like amidohydrolase